MADDELHEDWVSQLEIPPKDPTAEMFAQRILDQDMFDDIDTTPVQFDGFNATFFADWGDAYTYEITVSRRTQQPSRPVHNTARETHERLG